MLQWAFMLQRAPVHHEQSRFRSSFLYNAFSVRCSFPYNAFSVRCSFPYNAFFCTMLFPVQCFFLYDALSRTMLFLYDALSRTMLFLYDALFRTMLFLYDALFRTMLECALPSPKGSRAVKCSCSIARNSVLRLAPLFLLECLPSPGLCMLQWLVLLFSP